MTQCVRRYLLPPLRTQRCSEPIEELADSRVGERLPIVADAMGEKELTSINSVRDGRPILDEVRPELRRDARIENDGQILNVTFAMPLRLEVQFVGLTIDVVDSDRANFRPTRACVAHTQKDRYIAMQ